MKNKKVLASDFGIFMIKQTHLDISENDDLRSHYMWHLICNLSSPIIQDTTSTIPHTLVQFWDNAGTIPSDVRKCINSWEPLDELGFERLLFDDKSARYFIANNFNKHHLDAFDRCNHPAMRADYFRLCYLLKNGGFYIDADDVYKGLDIGTYFNDDKLKLQPLCYDISTDSMVNTADFLCKIKCSKNLIFYVNNDPIISPPNHPLIRMALERSTKSLLTSSCNTKDIQSTTGPGNLTACLVRHAIESQKSSKPLDFLFIDNWENISIPQWPLEYRKDKRNWRLWDGINI